MQMGGYTKSHT